MPLLLIAIFMFFYSASSFNEAPDAAVPQGDTRRIAIEPNQDTQLPQAPAADPPDVAIAPPPDAGDNGGAIIAIPSPTIVPEADASYVTVNLFFATNRNLTNAPIPNDPASVFGNFNTAAPTYGTATVSIPRIHQIGHLESQSWIVSVFAAPNPERHVILQEVTTLPQDEALAVIAAQLEAYENAILMYVHGFNTTFEKAARRAGQLTYDLGWHGPSIFFSWPSRGKARLYTVDQTMAERSELALQQVLSDLTSLNADRLVIIAHSMGTQILTQALENLVDEDPQAAARITTVVLAAPDIDVGLFNDRIVPAFAQMQNTQFTLYASSQDDALRASRAVNGFARIGDTSDGVTPIPGIDMIDATGATSDFFGHTYFGDNATILSDIFMMVREGRPPQDRSTLEPVQVEGGPTWRIVLDN